MSLTLSTAPVNEPVTLSQAKLHLRVDGTDDDTLIEALIVAARKQAEAQLNRVLVTQTWDWTLPAFPCDEIRFPRSPVSAVTHVKYRDENGALQTWTSTKYQTDLSDVATLKPAYGETWPSTRADSYDAVQVRFVAGYGTDPSVPEPITQWLLMQIGALYEHREAAAPVEIRWLPFVDGLLDPYRLIRVPE